MQYLAISTRVLQPPQDDLLPVLVESLEGQLQDGDVVIISSKVVAIDEGRCVAKTETTKTSLCTQEADIIIPRDYWSSPLTVTHSAFIGSAGIDESNANGYYILLPEDPCASARRIYAYLTKHFSMNQLGVIITDSHSTAMRRGATGIAVGFWGFEPTINHVGARDVFNREMKAEVSNLVDGLSAGATVVMGEVHEQTPIVIARQVPGLTFSNQNHQAELFCEPADDLFRVLYERFL